MNFYNFQINKNPFMNSTPQWDKLRVFLVDIVPPSFPQEEIEDRLAELESLVSTYQWIVIVKSIQKKTHPDYRTYVGSGKLQEILEDMREQKANLLIVWNILKPSQTYTISEIFRKDEIQVRDRVDLILKIFERHASSTEARLQIELAAIKHMGPRIFGMGMELSRQWGWIGWSGIGETNTERMKRHLKDKILAVQKKLDHYKNVRSLHRESRLRKDLFTVGIVWYTNAGKSCLMQAMTGKNVLVENKLFATLGTSVGQMKSDTWSRNILINDTIWFIRDLPPELIDAFASTLEDSIYAQLLLHVIDVNDPKMKDKIHIVDDILTRIGANQPKLYIFNKCDLLSPEKQASLAEEFAEYNPIFVSAYAGQWVNELKKIISEKAVK